MANEKNEKTLSTCIDELSEKTELADTDDILIKGKGVNALKTSILAIFHYINQKLELGTLAAKNKIEKADLDVSLSLEFESAFDSKLDTSQKGAANGVAELDSNGFIRSVQLPSFVDDVIEGYLHTDGNFYSDETHTNEILAEPGKIYIDLTENINKTYRWSGTAYVVISDTITLGETEGTAFRGDRGKLAYEHTLPENGTNPHGTTKIDVGLGNVENVTASDAVITYTEPDTPGEGDTESIPASSSTLKVIIGWLMKKVKTVSTAIINLSQSLDALNHNLLNMFSPVTLFSGNQQLVTTYAWNNIIGFNLFKTIRITFVFQGEFYTKYIDTRNDDTKIHNISFSALHSTDGTTRTVVGILQFAGRYVSRAEFKLSYNQGAFTTMGAENIYIVEIVGFKY